MDPPAIADAPIRDLLENLKRQEYRYRYWTKRELRERDLKAVKAELDRFVKRLDPRDARFRHHQVEAVWMYRSIGATNAALLHEVLNCDNHLARAAATRQLRYWSDALPDADAELRKRANDENGLVRLEAATAASYVGTRGALDAMLDTTKHPASAHLQYAIATSLGSQNLARLWKTDQAYQSGHPEIAEFFTKFGTATKAKAGVKTRTAAEAAFDNQKGLAEVKIACVPERMLYTVTRFEVKAGQPVKLELTNPDVTQHNLVIVQPGAAMAVGMAGNLMAAQKDGIKKSFIPESDKILHHTTLLAQAETQVLRFKAPPTPGEYPYLCTFPGHWVIMRGVMVVK